MGVGDDILRQDLLWLPYAVSTPFVRRSQADGAEGHGGPAWAAPRRCVILSKPSNVGHSLVASVRQVIVTACAMARLGGQYLSHRKNLRSGLRRPSISPTPSTADAKFSVAAYSPTTNGDEAEDFTRGTALPLMAARGAGAEAA
jgi:hypothetical protein